MVSTAAPNDAILAVANASTPDPAFGSGHFAYQMDGQTHTVALDLSYSVSDSASLNLGIEHQDTAGSGGIDYDANIVRATTLMAF